MTLLPLIPDDDPNAILAHREKQLITRALFLAHVLALAEALPSSGRVINMCNDRYAFAVALFAAISRGIVTVLPNSAAPEHLASVASEHPQLLTLGDQAESPIANLPYLDVSCFLASTTPSLAPVPKIPFDQSIAYVYTSGSTGRPVAHHKTFGRVHLNILAGAERIWAKSGGACSVVGTTPIRHMYGLESSVFLPILGCGRMAADIPFFPADVSATLADMPAPRLLVITPYHLRKLIEADIPVPPLATILSATAPLPPDLAREATNRFGCTVVEIYGSTETGQLATRVPCDDEAWETLAGVTLRLEGDDAWAHGDVYETPQAINDLVELLTPSRFRLLDRKANMINVAGKRSSLSFLNAIIAGIPGVHDAVFCVPGRNSNADVERLAAFVVAPGLSRHDILSGLREQIDPVFLPRPIVFIDKLPRDGNGKMRAATLDMLIAQHILHQGE
jgi:acyl-coenzyme A synthetase/AMP-(fatty) acid ligase